MARPQAHLAVTASLTVFFIWLPNQINFLDTGSVQSLLVALGALTTGVLIDTDHLLQFSRLRWVLARVRSGPSRNLIAIWTLVDWIGPNGYQAKWLHGNLAALLVVGLGSWLATHSLLPLAAYLVHLIMDRPRPFPFSTCGYTGISSRLFYVLKEALRC